MNPVARLGGLSVGDRVVTNGRILGTHLAQRRGTVTGFAGIGPDGNDDGDVDDHEAHIYRTDGDNFPVRVQLDDRTTPVGFALHEIRRLDPIEWLSELA